MNIFKTFETFLRENFIQIVSVQTGNIFANKPSVDISVVKGKTQVTVVNNEKLYKLLSLTHHRAEIKKQKEKVK